MRRPSRYLPHQGHPSPSPLATLLQKAYRPHLRVLPVPGTRPKPSLGPSKSCYCKEQVRRTRWMKTRQPIVPKPVERWNGFRGITGVRACLQTPFSKVYHGVKQDKTRWNSNTSKIKTKIKIKMTRTHTNNSHAVLKRTHSIVIVFCKRTTNGEGGGKGLFCYFSNIALLGELRLLRCH